MIHIQGAGHCNRGLGREHRGRGRHGWNSYRHLRLDRILEKEGIITKINKVATVYFIIVQS